MNPSRPAILAKVDALDAADFQHLAIEYARLRFPGRFRNLHLRGENPKGETIRGWPDAYEIPSDGIDVLEVTRAEDWRKHLNEDLEKAANTHRKIVGFVFVAWARTPLPDLNDEYQRKFRELGIPADGISFVFREQLVTDLCEARFALLWEKYLSLPAHCEPFAPIAQANIYGSVGNPNVFVPTRAEYDAGLVHRPALANKIEDLLHSRGWALVRGKGASGKTVMASQIALGPRFQNAPAYYVNLADEVEPGQMLEVITWRGDNGVLFIVDNVHLDEELARKVFDHWQADSRGSYLLLMGRWTQTGHSPKGVTSPLESLEASAATLEVQGADLLGVLHRLAGRLLTQEVRNPVDDVVKSWLALFGGDLIAFSAAVVRRIRQIGDGDCTLSAEDAKKYVRDTYLYPDDTRNPLSEEERQNLLLVATLSRLEWAAPSEALSGVGLRRSLKAGLVQRTEHGKDKYERFALIHPGFADLLLAAASPPVDQEKMYHDVALASPHAGWALGHRLESLGRSPDAAAVLRCATEGPQQLRRLLVSCTLNWTASNCDRIERLGAYSLEDIDAALKDAPDIVPEALKTPLQSLKAFLEYAEKKLPNSYAAVCRGLANPENWPRLVATALRTPGDLRSFLEYTQGRKNLEPPYKSIASALAKPEKQPQLAAKAISMPFRFLASFLDYVQGAKDLEPTYKSIISALVKPENQPQLVDAALRNPLSDLAFLLGYAQDREDLKPIYKSIAGALVKPENQPHLKDAALRAPLNDLAFFLGYVQGRKGLETTYKSIVSALVKPENQPHLADAALRTPLSHLVSFLSYVQSRKDLNPVYKSIARALVKPENQLQFAAVALRTPLADLTSFLKYVAAKKDLAAVHETVLDAFAEPANQGRLAESMLRSQVNNLVPFLELFLSTEGLRNIGAQVIGKIDRSAWDRTRLANPPDQPDYMNHAAFLFQKLGRPELMESPAQAAILAADAASWHAPGVSIYHLSHALRLAHSLDPEVVEHFLSTVVTDSWLKEQYQYASAGSIAGSLFSTWAYHGEGVVHYFLTKDLTERLALEVNRLLRLRERDLSGAIGLLGCCSLLGTRLPNPKEWPEPQQIQDLIKFASPKGDLTEIGFVQVQLWLGLRELARLRPGQLRIGPEFGAPVLSLWRNAKPERERHRCINKIMLPWLERCAQAGWILVREQRSLVEELSRVGFGLSGDVYTSQT
jgi:hypothetical protein